MHKLINTTYTYMQVFQCGPQLRHELVLLPLEPHRVARRHTAASAHDTSARVGGDASHIQLRCVRLCVELLHAVCRLCCSGCECE